MLMKNSNDTIGNRTRDLPTCSAVPQPAALLRAPTGTLDTGQNIRALPTSVRYVDEHYVI
jgi:hypothetical protein